MHEDEINLFEEEFIRLSQNKEYILLSEVLKISLLDENIDYKINFNHLHSDKDGRFKQADFLNLSRIFRIKENSYKSYDFRSQLQAYFTLVMWKEVCSEEGELIFINWIKVLLIETQMERQPHEDEEVNPDPTKYIDRTTLNLLYEILNVKLTHGIGFKTFFDLMQAVSEDMGLIDVPDSDEDYVHVEVLEIFCKNFIRGFSKLIVDLGFDVDDISI